MRSIHFQLSLISPPARGVVDTSCTELNTRDKLMDRRLRMPALICTCSFIAGTKLDIDTWTEYKSGMSSAKEKVPIPSVAAFSRRRSCLLKRSTMAPG